MFSSAKKKSLHVPVSKILRDPGTEKGKRQKLDALGAKRRGGSGMIGKESRHWRKTAVLGRNETSRWSPLHHLCSLEGAGLLPEANRHKLTKSQNTLHGSSVHQVNPWVWDGEESSFWEASLSGQSLFLGHFLRGWSHRKSREGACSLFSPLLHNTVHSWGFAQASCAAPPVCHIESGKATRSSAPSRDEYLANYLILTRISANVRVS